MSQPAIVAYRRTSSDMEMSSSDEETTEPQKSEIRDTRSVSMDLEERPLDAKIDNQEKVIKQAKKDGDRHSESERNREKKIDSSKDRDRRIVSDKDRDRRDTVDRERDRRDGNRDKRREDDKSRRKRSRSRSPHDRRSKYSPDRRRHERRRSPDRRSDSRYRHHRSPDTFCSRRLERKAARIDKLGLELYAEPKPGVIVNVPSRDGSVFGFANASPASRITEQIQKRRLLWQNKKEAVPEQSEPSSSKTWEAATFKGDNDGRMTEKFKRLMGMKGDGQPLPVKGAPEENSIIQKQEEMFSNMEAQYQVARMATHTHRGIGLGFGTFQVPPR